MIDARPSFDDAKAKFCEWMKREVWPDDILWLTSDRVIGRKNRYWLFRPQEMIDDSTSRRFYEAARLTASSLRIDAFCQTRAKTIAYVEDYGGDSRFLNFGILTGKREISMVESRFQWAIRRSITWIQGRNPFLKNTRMP